MRTHGIGTHLRRAARRLIGRDGIVRIDILGPDSDNPDHTLIDLAVRFAGRELTLTVRDDTTDLDLIDMILSPGSTPGSMYRLPRQVQPKVIFDVGANIGVAAVYFATVYPDADIYCFEPLPANISLLKRNAARNSERIHVIPRGLSDTAGSFTYQMSADACSFGGGTFRDLNGQTTRALQLSVDAVADAIADAGVERVDVFKIDTEGSEWPILRGIPARIRAAVQAYVGELHGEEDWEFCQLLAQTHELDLDKRYHRNCHPFMAIHKDLLHPHIKPLAA